MFDPYYYYVAAHAGKDSRSWDENDTTSST